MPPVPVCHLRFSDLVGGVETHIVSLLQALDADRYSASVITFPNPAFEERLAEAGIAFDRIERRGRRDLGFARRLRRLLRQRGARIAHTHGVYSDFYMALAGRLWWRRPRHVLTKHTFADADMSASAKHIRRIDRFDRWMIYPRVHRIVAVSEERKRGLIERQGVRESKITVIHNGIPLDPHLSPHSLPRTLRRELEVGERTPIIGFIGRLAPEKGPDLFVDLFARLAKRSPEALGVVVGDGPMADDLRRRAEGLGVAERMRWLPHRQDLPPLLLDMDVVVMPSRTEGLPMLLLEAMAMARPVVASDVGGIPEVIERGRSGWLCAMGDVEGFATTIARVLEHPEASRLVGEQSRAVILARFTARTMADRMMALYDEALGIA